MIPLLPLKLTEAQERLDWLHNSVIYGYLAIAAYIVSYSFQVGYLGHFNMPTVFIETSLNNIVITFGALIIFANIAVFKIFYWLWIGGIFSKIVSTNRKFSLGLRFILHFWCVETLLVFMPFYFGYRDFVKLVIVSVLIFGTMLVFYIKREKRGVTLKKNLMSRFIDKNECAIYALIFVLVLAMVAFLAGWERAMHQKNFQIIKDKKEYGIVYMTKDFALAIPIEGNTLMIDLGFKIYELKEIRSQISHRNLIQLKQSSE